MDIQEKKALQRRRKAQKKATKKARRERLLEKMNTDDIEVINPEPKLDPPVVEEEPSQESSSYCVVQ
jgi:hypothetical protein